MCFLLMLSIIVAIAGISLYACFKTNNALVRLGASIPWLWLWRYLSSNYANEDWMIFAVSGCWCMAIGILLSLLQRQIDTTPTGGGTMEAAEDESPTGSMRRMWNSAMGNSNANTPRPKAKPRETAEEYQIRVKSALRRKK